MPRLLPRVAVLIPAYNAEKSIKKCIASLNQNSEPHDIIVVDDGSKIPVQDILPAQNNLTIISPGKNVGVYRALNIGLDHIYAKGYELIARIDADDAASADRLKKQVAFMDSHPDIVFVGSWGRVISETGGVLFYLNLPTDNDSILRKSWYNSAFIQPTVMMRSAVVKEAGGYDLKYLNASADYEISRRLAKFGKLANLPEYMIDYTYSLDGISVKKRRLQLSARLKIQWAYRDFTNYHFYMGILKTFVLWYIPIDFLKKIKMNSPIYKMKTQ